MTKEVMQQALEALEEHEGNYKLGKSGCERQEKAITAIKEALAQPVQEPAHGDIRALKHRIHELEGEVIGYKQILQEAETAPLPVQEPVGDEWTPCMKLPVVVHVRQQRPGETHVSTREGIAAVEPDDLIMKGVSGEEYPIGRVIFEQTYSLNTTPPAESPVQEPVSMRMPKVGDRIVCFEDESLGEVVSLTAGGSPDITFDDGSRGTYMLSEFAELFGYVTPPAAAQPEQEPVAFYHPQNGFYWAKPTRIFAPTVVDVPPIPLYTTLPAAQRPWQGLTPEDLAQIDTDEFWQVGNHMAIAMAVEDKLKERNNG